MVTLAVLLSALGMALSLPAVRGLVGLESLPAVAGVALTLLSLLALGELH